MYGWFLYLIALVFLLCQVRSRSNVSLMAVTGNSPTAVTGRSTLTSTQAISLTSVKWGVVTSRHTPELAAQTHEGSLQVSSAPFSQHGLLLPSLVHDDRWCPLTKPGAPQEPFVEPFASGDQPKRMVRVPRECWTKQSTHPLQRSANVGIRRRGLFQTHRSKGNALMWTARNTFT